MRINKLEVLTHHFEFSGEPVSLTINNSFTTTAYKEFKKQIQAAQDTEDVEQLCELVCFFIRDWDLEDEAGKIPLTVEAVSGRVPVVVLGEITRQAQEAIQNGGLEKKSAS